MPTTGVPEELTGALAERYRIERRLGEGGAAVVYLATDLKHDRRVAIKVLRPELFALTGAERFVAEIRTTANLQHPHILPLFDSGEVAGAPFYVMPYVEGESLRDRLERVGTLSVEEALRIAGDVASALDYAHARGVVHRDIKPANILLSSGEALVADFGIALALSELGAERMTATGLSVGTPWYMAPEQMAGGGPVDGRADVYALGCMLFEMLTGTLPFQGASLPAVMTRVLTESPPRMEVAGARVPESVEAAVARALAKAPADRFGSALELISSARAGAGPAVQPVRRRGTVVALAAAAMAVAAGVWAWRTVQLSSARGALPEIASLVEAGEYREAFRRAEEVESWIEGDPELGALMQSASAVLEVTSLPEGAEVLLQEFPAAGANPLPARSLGRTPTGPIRLPRVDHRLVVQLEGYRSAETIVSSELGREWLGDVEGRVIALDVELVADGEAPPGTVPVPGGEYQLTSPDAPTQEVVALAPFFMDRFETTNESFAGFVRDGGYDGDEWWTDTPEAVRASLVDRTGLPGPRSWSRQRYPEGEGRRPVTGVSWWEAQAYCRYRGGRLPTVFEWEKTARAGAVSRYGVIMPWGLQMVANAGPTRANFNSSGPVDVDTYPFGISPYGAYGMAGNVSEWTLNPFGEGRAITGGSWAGPSYLYTEYADERPDFAAPSLGFRCAYFDGAGDQGGVSIDLDVAPPSYTPVDRAVFETLLEYYRYDRVEPQPRISEVAETDSWTRERIWIDGPAGDSVLVYLWLPKAVAPPYQTIVFVPGSSVFFDDRLPDDVELTVGPVIQSGRAVLATVMFGMNERSAPGNSVFLPTESVGFRDLMVRHATEMRLAMDYAESRPEVDGEAFAYMGTSWGAGSRLVFSAVDDRFKAVVYLGAGIDERVKPTLPAADNVNFAPYIDAPILMVNGRNDEEHPWIQRARPLWELLPEPKTLELIDGAGHMPPVEDRIPPINRFLDRVLGPVR